MSKIDVAHEDSTLLLQAIFNTAIDGIVTIDAFGKIESLNPAAAQMFGYEPRELIGFKINVLMPEPDYSNHDRYISDYHRTGKAKIIGIGREVRGKKKNGETFPFILGVTKVELGSRIVFAGFIHDITELKLSQEQLKQYTEELEARVEERTFMLARSNKEIADANKKLKLQVEEVKKAQIALRQSQRLYQAIGHNFPDGIIHIVDSVLDFMFVDGKDLKELDYRPQDILYKNIKNLEGQYKSLFKVDEIKSCFAGKTISYEAHLLHKNWFYLVDCVPLRREDKSVRSVLIVCKNITEQKRAEIEIRKALEKEKELGELKSRFVTTASHEFRTPLSAILSSAALIGRYSEGENSERIDKHIDRIKSSVNNLNQILGDFLSLGKLEEGKTPFSPLEFDLIELIDNAIMEIKPVLKTDQVINFDQVDVLSVYLDRQMCLNIVINLLSNASKYSDEGKEINIKTWPENNHVVIEIRDQGIGIPEKEQEHLFERFFRAKNAINIQGTGLGLNIVQKYVEMMRGSIQFVSKEMEGTTFRVFLPKRL